MIWVSNSGDNFEETIVITAPSKNPVLQPPHKRIDWSMRNPLIRFPLALPATSARSLARVSSATLVTLAGRPAAGLCGPQRSGRSGDHDFTSVRTYGIGDLRIRHIGAAQAGAEPE